MSSLQYKLKITVINDLDTFVGYNLSSGPCSLESVESFRNSIIKNINSLTFLTLHADDGTYILLNADILKKSVIKLKIVPVGVGKE